MYYIYILYSSSASKYYTGYSENPWRRVTEHNNSPFNSYTSKYRPWKLQAVFECGSSAGVAMKLERFIKNQKSSKLLQLLCDPEFEPVGALARLVRVPHLRD